jgi:hypothetical protein
MATDTKVTIEFKLQGSEEWLSIPLSTDQYFDLEPGERPSMNSVPDYVHAVQYLKVPRESVHMTRLTLEDSSDQARRFITETFWNQGENRVIERLDTGTKPFWEMIVEVKVIESPPTWEILRLRRQDGIPLPSYHGFITNNEDGSQTEVKVI